MDLEKDLLRLYRTWVELSIQYCETLGRLLEEIDRLVEHELFYDVEPFFWGE